MFVYVGAVYVCERVCERETVLKRGAMRMRRLSSAVHDCGLCKVKSARKLTRGKRKEERGEKYDEEFVVSNNLICSQK